jgi:hypothetical protein
MADRNMTGVERRGNDFAIVHYDDNGVKSELILPEAVMLSFAPALPRLLREKLEPEQSSQMAQQGVEQVNRAIVLPDLHGTEVLVHFVDELGNRTSYGIEPALAKQLGEQLIARAGEAEKIRLGKSR